MKTLNVLSLALISSITVFNANSDSPKPKYGPAGASIATPLSRNPQYLRKRKNLALDFWATIGFYVHQEKDTCSAAAASTVLNALRVDINKTAEEKNVTQEDLLNTITSPGWHKSELNLAKKSGDKDAIAKAEAKLGGDADGNCASLSELKTIMEEALAWKEIRATVKKVHIDPSVVEDPSSVRYADARAALITELERNEKSRKNFMIINFNQKSFTDDADVGHMSTIAAFDQKKEKVLILDPDRDYYEPYWVSVDALLKGMATMDKAGKFSRGYLFIEKR